MGFARRPLLWPRSLKISPQGEIFLNLVIRSFAASQWIHTGKSEIEERSAYGLAVEGLEIQTMGELSLFFSWTDGILTMLGSR